ncbi:hypothetical protein [Aphanothece sacrum]|uniref:Uncharacterized protein n=1 Tax=Aphanothece sacrum FPU1 TaxID=1920663 RepID=A0A401IND7_APHSA|nr:hypothetical protein [Aphanothece sacrum]GBF82759.1 hypothetical protein AsFPU1_4193 [Aphanothece sacrum FPU1]GBF85717.1 hypothetical protein AsFPU3_2782 [Aphanothece sacrum FPU3]
MAKDEIDKKVNNLYQLAKKLPDDTNLQESIAVIKTLRLSQGQYKRWNNEYRIDNTELKEEIEQLEENNQGLQGQIIQISNDNNKLKIEIVKLSQDNDSLKSELATINQEMVQLTQEKQNILAEKSKVIAELKNIETEIELAVMKVKETKSLFGKFSILWTVISGIFQDNIGDYGKIDNALPTYADKPQMNIDPAAIGKDLLNR